MAISKVFQFLNENGIRYSIIEIDPYKRKKNELSGEIDIVINNKGDFSKLINVLVSDNWKVVYSFSEFGFERCQLIKRDFMNDIFYKLDLLNSFFHEQNDKLFSINNIDGNEFEIIEDRTYLKGDNLYLIYLLKILIEGKKDKIKALHKFCDKDFFLLEDLNSLVENNTISNYNELLIKLVKEGVVVKEKTSTKVIFFKKVANFFRRYVFMKDIPMIGFIGLDGAGKSTIIANIGEKLRNQDLACNIVYLGHRDFELKWLRNINNEKSKSVLNTLLYVLLWPIEVRLRVYKAVKVSNFLLFDRHPAYEPILPRSKKMKFVVLKFVYDILAKLLIPTPNFNFFLTGDNLVLWNRKKEDTFESYEKRVLKLKMDIEHVNIKTFTVRTDVDIKDSLITIKTKILEYFKEIT